MKTITVSIETANGNFDMREVRAENFADAKAKVISENKARLASPMFKDSTEEIIKVEEV